MLMDDIISRTLAWARPNDSDNLIGFVMDADHAFEATDMFDSVHVERTADPSRLIVIHLVVRENAPSLESIASALREAWSRLAYVGFQASKIEQYRDATVMRFVTASSDGRLCVTGEAIAVCAAQERLVAEFEESFPSAGRIPSR